MLEKAFIAAIHRRIHNVHHQSMTGASMTTNGIVDHYYDGSLRDLWVEYKALDRVPRDGVIRVNPVEGAKQPRGRLTPLQLRWLCRRWSTGKNAVVIVGLPNRTAILMDHPDTWIREGKHYGAAMDIAEVSKWITNFCGEFSTQQLRSYFTQS